MKISIGQYYDNAFKDFKFFNWYQIHVQGTPFEIEVLEDWWENESAKFVEYDVFFGNYTAVFDVKEETDVVMFKMRWL